MEYGGGDVPLPEGDPTTAPQMDEEELMQLLMEQAPMEQGIMAAMGGPVGTPNDVYYFGVPQITNMMQDPNPQIQGVGMQLADQMQANPAMGMVPATRDQIQGMAEGGAITAKKFSEGDATFRDPVMEERGYAFDPERNAYYEDVMVEGYDEPIRSYFSPRDQSPVTELSDARREAEGLERLEEELTKRYANQTGGRPIRRGFKVGDTISMTDVFSKEEIMDKAKRQAGIAGAKRQAGQTGRTLSDKDLERAARFYQPLSRPRFRIVVDD